MSDAENEEVPVVIDYKELDEDGFLKVEHIIWKAWVENLQRPEEERQDVETFVEEYAESSKYERPRIKFVCTMGTYAGKRDEFLQRSGVGRALYPNGDIYDGDYYEGQKNGRGHYIFTSAGKSEMDALVEKEWKRKAPAESMSQFVARVAQELHVGKLIVETIVEHGAYPCYQGEYVHGLRNGPGWMKNKDGSVYRGEWKDNLRHGTGTMHYVNGDVYAGTWEAGYRSGFGTYVFAGGHSEFKGEWVKGSIVNGHWIMCDQTIYEGAFLKNYPHDANGSLHFPRLGLSLRGTYAKHKWLPVMEYIPMNDALRQRLLQRNDVLAIDAPNL